MAPVVLLAPRGLGAASNGFDLPPEIFIPGKTPDVFLPPMPIPAPPPSDEPDEEAP